MMELSLQLSFALRTPPLAPRNSSTGSFKTSVSPACWSEGPRARMTTFFGALPVIINPPIIMLSPLCTRMRVEMLSACAFRCGRGLADGLGEGLADGLGEAPGEGLG